MRHARWFLATILHCSAAAAVADEPTPAVPQSWRAVELWTTELPGDVTGACYVPGADPGPAYFVCADKVLLALDQAGRRLEEYASPRQHCQRLLALDRRYGRTAFIGHRNWGEEVLLFDRAGALITTKSFGDDGIYNVCLSGPTVFVQAGKLHKFELGEDDEAVLATQDWPEPDVGHWDVAAGDFGGGYALAVSHGSISLLTALGRQGNPQDFGFVTSLGSLPLGEDRAAVVAINDVPGTTGSEEVIAMTHDRTVFRQRLGKNDGPACWRWRRLVAGRFLSGDTPQVAVLRGDGSVVVLNRLGQPVHLLPAHHERQAIELGGPEGDRDTLLCCEPGMLRRFVFPAAMPADIAEAKAAVRNPNAELLRVSPRDTAEDLWARALWLSLPMNDAASEEVASLFTAALARARSKAPIYVSFGDAGSGPKRLQEMLASAVEAVQQEAVLQFAAQLERTREELDASDPDAAEEALSTMLQSSFEKALRGLATGELPRILETARGGGEESMVYYLAAVAEEPSYKPAWFRLAKHGQGETRERALAELMKLDPDDSLPHYLRAADQAEAGDLAAALASVQAGNGKGHLRIYPSPRPQQFKLHYPDDEFHADHEFLQDMDLAGKPIAPSCLEFWLDHFDELLEWADPSGRQFRTLSRSLTDEGARLLGQGKLPEAIAHLEAIQVMGWSLMQVEPRDGGVMIRGLLIALGPVDHLRGAYEAAKEPAKLAALEECGKVRERFRLEFRKSLEAGKLTKDELKLVLEGKKDTLAEDRQRLDEALRTSGISTAPIPKTRQE